MMKSYIQKIYCSINSFWLFIDIVKINVIKYEAISELR